MAELTLDGVCAGYRGKTVVHDMSLRYGAGVHILLGPNGAGKTTTFRVLAGILAPTRGRVLVGGTDPHTSAEAKALIGMATHRSALAPRLSVVDNLRYWARVLGMRPAAAEAAIAEVLGVLGLARLADERIGALSRGQNQRVGLAKAFLAGPPILLLDEPMSGLDPQTSERLSDHLRRLADNGCTVVVSTHALVEAHRLADDVTVLYDGRIVGQGEPAELRRALLGSAYRLQLRGSGDIPGALDGLGHRWERQGTGPVVVEVADQQAAEALVTALVAAGVGLHEVVPVRNPLEDVYLQLQSGGDARMSEVADAGRQLSA
ncbi:ABC transporter ATP-binding protein [Kitasatospora sp. NPDC059571]|uniref:ABC transporter ATP-binding protein n=1 Tax=Kitasatospora sp. NPDC059571 TaxID=3346871 RepID=UPI0036871936